MLPDLLSDSGFTWSETRIHLPTGKPMRSYQLRAAYKIFMGEPVRDQTTGKKDLLDPTRDGVAVHIDPGLGKTITALTAVVEWKKRGLLKRPVLIVAPIKVCETVWQQEARNWTHTQGLTFELIRGDEKRRAFAQKRHADIHLINAEMLSWLRKYIRANWEYEYFALIIDDVPLKDNRSKQFRVLSNYGTRELVKDPFTGKVWQCPLTGLTKPIPPPRFQRVAKLTGTPATSGLQNLWAPFYLIDHGARLHKTYDTFQGRFFHKTKQVAAYTFDYELNPEEDEVRPDWMAREGAPERIHELIADVTIEIDASEYGILPKEVPPIKHYIDLPTEILPYYRQLEKQAVFEMLKDPIIAANGGAKSGMCWQICNGALYSTDEYGKKTWSEIHSRKLDKLVEIVNDLDTSALIPYWFNHDRERIMARFKAEGIPYSVMGPKNALDIVERWNKGQITNLLFHPQGNSHGLNMQFGGHTLVWFSTISSLDKWIQTKRRLARSGQEGIVSTHVIMARNTTDDVRFNSLTEHGDEQARFRSATLKYQRTMGLDLGSMPELGNFQRKPFEGINL